MNPDLVTRFVFNDTVIVEVSSDNQDTVMVEVSRKDDHENAIRCFHLHPDEVDVFISSLTLYKNRILNPKKSNIK